MNKNQMGISKQERFSAIKALIAGNKIENQEELVGLLRQRGVETTQATLSRDMKELKVFKGHTSDDRYVYRLPSAANPSQGLKDATLIRPGFNSIQFSGLLAVIKTRPGYASSIASDIDLKMPKEVIGTIAGDDTILLIPRESISREEVLDFLSLVIPNVKEQIIK